MEEKRQILIIKYERKIATSKNNIKKALYRAILRFLNGKYMNNKINEYEAKEIRNIDKEFYEYISSDDLEKDEIKENYKWS